MASEEPEEESVGLIATMYQYTVFIGVLTWIIYLVWRKLRQQGLTDKLESDLLVSLSQQIIKVCSVCEKLLPFHSSQKCKFCACAVCSECCIEQQCSTCYLDKSTSSLLGSPQFQSQLRSKLESNLASLDISPNGGRGDNLEVRDLMERLVESLVEEHLDDTPITALSSHPAYKPVAPSETTGAVQNQLKSLIVQVLREANSLPPIQLNSSEVSNNVENLKSKTYEDILATTILNKIVEKCQHSKTVTSSSEDKDSSGTPLKSVNTSVKATCEFKIGPLDCASGRDSHDEDGKDFQDGAQAQGGERVWSKGRTSLLCTTVEHIEEVITRYSPNEYEKEEKGGLPLSLTVTDQPSRGVPSLYGATYERDGHRAACPELGRDIVDGSALLEEGYDSDSSINIGIEFINDLETWEENWLFSKRKAVPNPRAAAHHPVPVPMLVPCPASDQTCRTLIGDVDAAETSDLSECSDSMYDDPIFTSRTASLRVGCSSESPSLRVGGSSSSEEDEDNTEAWVEARNERLLLSTPIDSGEGSLEVTEEESALPFPNDENDSKSSRPVPKPRKNTVGHNKHQTSNGLRDKPPTGLINRKHSNGSVTTNQPALKTNDSKYSTEKFLENERNTQHLVIKGDPHSNFFENNNHKVETTNSHSNHNLNGTIKNKGAEVLIETDNLVENNQNDTMSDNLRKVTNKLGTEQLGEIINEYNKESPIVTNQNQKQSQNNIFDTKNINTKDQNTIVNDNLDGACEEKTEPINRNQTKLNKEEFGEPISQEIKVANSKQSGDKLSEETKNPNIKETTQNMNNVEEKTVITQEQTSNTVKMKEDCVTKRNAEPTKSVYSTAEETKAIKNNEEDPVVDKINTTVKEGKKVPVAVKDQSGRNSVQTSKNLTAVKDETAANAEKKNKEVPMIMKDNIEVATLPKSEETIAKESYDREHEAELGEIEILNTPPKPGTIAEREHAKWQQAVPLENNPYSKENIEKRNRQRLFDMSRSASSDQTDNDETDHSRPESIIVTTTSSPDMIKRYSRDYYINNSCGTPSSHLSSSNTSLSSIGKVAHSVKPGGVNKSKGATPSQKRGERRSKDLDDLKRPPNVSSEESSEEFPSLLDRDVEDETKDVNSEGTSNDVVENDTKIGQETYTSETIFDVNGDIVNNVKMIFECIESSNDELKCDNKENTQIVDTKFHSTIDTASAEINKEDAVINENYSLSMDDTGFSDIKTIQSTQNNSEDVDNGENYLDEDDICSVNASNTCQNNGTDIKNIQSTRKNSLIEKSASHSDILKTKKNNIRYISTQTLPNQTFPNDGKPAKKKSKNLFASIKKFLTKKKSKSISKCESSQSIWFADKSLQNIYSDTWNQRQQDQMKRESFDDELLDTFRKTKLEQIENFIRNEQGTQSFNNFDYLKNMSEENSSVEENMMETVAEKSMEQTVDGKNTNTILENLGNSTVKINLGKDIHMTSQSDDENNHDKENLTQRDAINMNTSKTDGPTDTEPISSKNLDVGTLEQNNKSNASTLERRQNNNSQPIQVVIDNTERPCGDIIVHVDSDNGVDDVESIENLDVNSESSTRLKRNDYDLSVELGTSEETTSDQNKNGASFAGVEKESKLEGNNLKILEISNQERALIIKQIDSIFEYEGLNITFDDSMTSIKCANLSDDTSEKSIRLSNDFFLPGSLDRSILQKKQEEIHEKNIQRTKTTIPFDQDVLDSKIRSSAPDYHKRNEDEKTNETNKETLVKDSKIVDEEISDKITDKFDMENIAMQKSFLIPADSCVSKSCIESFSDQLAGSLEEYVLRNSLHHKTLKPKNSPATANFSVNPLYSLEQDVENIIKNVSESGEQNNEGTLEDRRTGASTPETSLLDVEYNFHLRKTPESGYSSTVETVRGTTPDLPIELRKVSECEEMVVSNPNENYIVQCVTRSEVKEETLESNCKDFDDRSAGKNAIGVEIKCKDVGDKSEENGVKSKSTNTSMTIKAHKTLLEPGIILDQRIVLERRNILSPRSPIPSPRAVRNEIIVNNGHIEESNDMNLSKSKAISVLEGNVPNEKQNASHEKGTQKKNQRNISTEKNETPVEPTNLGEQLCAEFVKLTNVFSKSVENLGVDSDPTEIKHFSDEISEPRDGCLAPIKRLSGPTIVPYEHLKELSNVQNSSNFNTRL